MKKKTLYLLRNAREMGLLFQLSFYIFAAILSGCDIIPVQEHDTKIQELNDSLLKENIAKFESCFPNDLSKRKINFYYRIRHVPSGILDIFSTKKAEEGCIACFISKGKIPAYLEIKSEPANASDASMNCLKNVMYDLRFTFADQRVEYEDVSAGMFLFDN
jgi:hypothetical protein